MEQDGSKTLNLRILLSDRRTFAGVTTTLTASAEFRSE